MFLLARYKGLAGFARKVLRCMWAAFHIDECSASLMAQHARSACSELRIYAVVVTDGDCRVNRSVVSDKIVDTLQIPPLKSWEVPGRWRTGLILAAMSFER
jgi:hypothetical protein